LRSENFLSHRDSNEVEGKEQYCVEISNRFAALENLDTEVDVNKARETIRENIKISAKESLGYYEVKKNKPWFDEGCSKLKLTVVIIVGYHCYQLHTKFYPIFFSQGEVHT
jgi:hypothetical protein